MNDICRTPAQVCERLSNEYGDLTVVLFGDALEGSMVKAKVPTNTKYICFKDTMETGKSVANILSEEFINVRAEEYRKANETIESALERYGKECLAPMEYLKSRKNSKVVFLTFDNYVCSIWQLTVMAFLESQGICNSIVRIVVNDNDWMVGSIDHIELAGVQQAYESILCNHNFISLDQYKISEEAVKGWLDIQSPNGVLVNFIKKECRGLSVLEAFRKFLFDLQFQKWGVSDVVFKKIALSVSKGKMKDDMPF